MCNFTWISKNEVPQQNLFKDCGNKSEGLACVNNWKILGKGINAQFTQQRKAISGVPEESVLEYVVLTTVGGEGAGEN